MKRASLLVLIVGATTLAACDGLKEALTAHVDVVARAGSQELSVTRLSDMLGNAKIQIPINKDVATLVARDLWVPYQLLGTAGAHGDSLNDKKAEGAALLLQERAASSVSALFRRRRDPTTPVSRSMRAPRAALASSR